jgi:hypothetical protein
MDKEGSLPEASSSKGQNCLFKRMKRGGGNVTTSNRRQPTQKSSSSSSSDNSDENSDSEVYKKPKKSRTGLVQSTSSAFSVNPEKRKRRWKKHLDGQNTSSESEEEGEKKSSSDFGVKFKGSGALQSSGPSDQGATATVEIDTSHDLVSSYSEKGSLGNKKEFS